MTETNAMNTNEQKDETKTPEPKVLDIDTEKTKRVKLEEPQEAETAFFVLGYN
ncbi:hypothetical protein Q4574_03005 [Aliiglaciecola sp. 3_MG-2023]|uniref:hypothetical protein n=1 Tax=Aliiglaciecola sp. 3_MG-2023 TaxID=3062644 RepID=UPI0026E37058|nr:hypothetical protein [Aliiglaciecola sp. 3_MG-2023]MDO6692234.1 hypothetical protein [Aliiglaciecola sp. 3_MG-2023]